MSNAMFFKFSMNIIMIFYMINQSISKHLLLFFGSLAFWKYSPITELSILSLYSKYLKGNHCCSISVYFHFLKNNHNGWFQYLQNIIAVAVILVWKCSDRIWLWKFRTFSFVYFLNLFFWKQSKIINFSLF
jgi:hypothetical protein